jgi:nucleolar protein 16
MEETRNDAQEGSGAQNSRYVVSFSKWIVAADYERAFLIRSYARQNRSWTRFDPNPKVNKALKEHWDASLTPAKNLEKLGLVACPNGVPASAAATNRDNKNGPREQKSVIELFDVPDSDAPSRRSKFPLNREEEEYVCKCMTKYGVNYTRMFRDTKLNDMQYTEETLRKMGSRYMLLTPDQRRVDIPDKIKHLVPAASEDNQC